MVFREHIITQCLLALVFCAAAHGFWITCQWLIVLREMTWSSYLTMLVQVVLVSAYTAIFMPLGRMGLDHCRRWLIVHHPGRSRRERGS